MNIYGAYGFNDFILALGYKGESIKEYFLNYAAMSSDFEVDLSTGEIKYIKSKRPNWKVRLVDTGENSMTGGRLLRLKDELASEKSFMLTYGDGVSNVDLKRLTQFHSQHGKLATVTAVRPVARFGGIHLKDDQVDHFIEKPQGGEGWINGGFFVFNQGFMEYLEDDQTILERAPLERATKKSQLMAYRHDGYWQCMDTIRDRQLLEEQWASGDAP
jgi:glucose-1-phosphate cytidylyltransferase